MMMRNIGLVRLAFLKAAFLTFALAIPTDLTCQITPQPSVDPFTGAFHCQIPLLVVPGPHGGGYTVTMSYSSDVTAEQEASWVGYGWSLEPPRIVRQRRGMPDDTHEEVTTYDNRGSMTSTVVTLQGNVEVLANDKSNSPTAGGALALEFNSLTGFDVRFTTLLSGKFGLTENFGMGAGLSYDTKGRFSSSVGFNYRYAGQGSGLSLGTGTSLFTYDPTASQRPTVGGMRPLGSSSTTITEGTLRVSDKVFMGWEGGASLALTNIRFGARDIKGSGYLYSPLLAGNEASKSHAIDYVVDRERNVTSKDSDPLPMALPAYDLFHVQAPGLGGTFRAHHALPLVARPPVVTSEVDILSFSLKGILGTSVGAGAGASLPMPARYRMSSGGEYGSDLESDVKLWNDRMVPFFRFLDDPAQAITYSEMRHPLETDTRGLSRLYYHPVGGQGASPRMNKSVEYKTHTEVSGLFPLLNNPRYFFRLLPWSSYGNMPLESINEFAITNEGGTRYEFGAIDVSMDEVSTRVVNKEKKSFLVSLTDPLTNNNTRIAYAPYRASLYSAEEGTEERSTMSYATAWNATAILGPNYVDIGDDGPNNGDVGAWTKFGYFHDGVRQWRSPYTGYYLDRGDPSNNDDDVLMWSKGRSVDAVLRSIETETHVAFFFTSQNPMFIPYDSWVVSMDYQAVSATQSAYNYPVPEKRKDNLDAFDDRDESARVPSPRIAPVPPSTRPYLTRIELWVKGADGKPKKQVKAIHFAYDYSVCPGNPSSEPNAANPNQNLGKLTLRRVWQEDRDVQEPTIQPVEFFYEYPQLGAASTPEKDGINIGALQTRYPGALPSPSGGTQNPAYDPNDIDAWGQQSGVRPFLSGTSIGNDEPQRYGTPQLWHGVVRDPAAWRLKTIRLPSGARIVPHYERRTYSWVQDKAAMGLCALTPDSRDCSTNPVGDWYHVSLASTGVTATTPASELTAYFESIKARFLQGGEPMYFKFAHSVEKCDPADGSNVKYCRGYAAVTEMELLPTTPPSIRLRLGTMSPLGTRSADNILGSQKTSPFYIAYRSWRTFWSGKCDPAIVNPIEALSRLIDNAHKWKWQSDEPIPMTVLPRLVATKSQLRLPLFRSKCGDGVRVKRLLMISPSGTLETGDEALIGSEYIYGVQDASGNEVTSWGVATDEPIYIREENPVVGIMRQHWSGAAAKVFDEEDMATKEEPLAGSLLPSPRVGYSQVIIRPINRQANAPGYTVNRFLTVRDVPSVRVERQRSRILQDYFDNASLLMVSQSEFRLDIAQSYAITVADYHGLPRSTEKFAGVHGIGDVSLVSSVRYDYLMPSDTVYMYEGVDSTLHARLNIDAQDIVSETRYYSERLNTSRVDVSFEVTTPPPPLLPLPGIGVGFSYTDIDHNVRLGTSTNITRYSPRLVRTISMDNGRIDTSRIIAWDQTTGLPAMTGGTDAYDNTNAPGASPAGNHVGDIVLISDPLLARYPQLGHKTKGYRARLGANRVVPVIGRTNAMIATNGNIRISREQLTGINASWGPPSELVPRHNAERNALLLDLFAPGDVLHLTQAGSIKAAVEVTGFTSPGAGMVDLAYRVLGGTMPTGLFEVTRHESGRRNIIGASSENRAVYGLNFESQKANARSLHSLESSHIAALNQAVRRRTGAIDFRHYRDDGLVPSDANYKFWFEFRRGTFTPFIPNQIEHVQDLEFTTVPSACSGNHALQSKYAFALHRAYPATGQVHEELRVGVIRPFGETGCTWETYPFNICGYNWLESPNVSNSCWQNAWAQFPGSATEQVVDAYQWDEWMRFGISDSKRVFVSSIPDNTQRENTGALHIRNSVGESAMAVLPAGARELAHGCSMWGDFVRNVGSRFFVQWLPITQWTWQSGVKPSESAVAGRVFEAAGTFAAPSSAPTTNWVPPATATTPTPAPALSGSGGWHRDALVLNVDVHGRPLAIADKMGNMSVMQYDAAGYSSEAGFSLATLGLSWYENFESAASANIGAAKFTGAKGRVISPTSTTTIDRPTRAVPGTSTTAEDVVIRLWLQPSDLNHAIAGNISVQGTNLTTDDIVATINGWSLIETRRSVAPASPAITISASGMSCSTYVDDVVVHQPVGSASAVVFDAEHRPVASFNSDHFPSRVAYDARGKTAITHAQKASGTVASAAVAGNLPRKARPSLGAGAYASGITMPMRGPRAAGFETDAIDDTSQEIQDRLKDMVPSGNGVRAKGTLLDFKANPEGVMVDPLIGPAVSVPLQTPVQSDTTKKGGWR